jgi:hypothetical protein
MVTRTGLEAASFQAIRAPDDAHRSPERGSTEPLDAPPRAATAPDVPARAGGVTALAAYVEAVGRLAAEAIARGDVALAQELLEQARRVAAVASTDIVEVPVGSDEAR